jgi:hypothetical protein
VLKCEQGFVGYKSASSSKLECNKATYETIQVERSEKGIVFFKGVYSDKSHMHSYLFWQISASLWNETIPEEKLLKWSCNSVMFSRQISQKWVKANKLYHIGVIIFNSYTLKCIN